MAKISEVVVPVEVGVTVRESNLRLPLRTRIRLWWWRRNLTPIQREAIDKMKRDIENYILYGLPEERD